MFITFKDGSKREFENGLSAEKIAESISISLKKRCIVAKVNGKLVD